MLLLSLFFRVNEAIDVNSKSGWKKVMIGPAGSESQGIIPGNCVAVIYESGMLVTCYNLISPMTLTSCLFGKQQTNKIPSLNTFFVG